MITVEIVREEEIDSEDLMVSNGRGREENWGSFETRLILISMLA